MPGPSSSLDILEAGVVGCTRCPRLAVYIRQVAAEKRRAFRDQTYWGKPLPSFGDPDARLLVIGLAPAAHGGNRTGRMFTGDRSGDFLFAALHRTGFSNQAESRCREDGLRLRDCYITAAVRCAPPGNKPLPAEFANCRPYLERSLELLEHVQVVVALGRIAFDAYLGVLKDRGQIRSRAGFAFGHGLEHRPAAGAPVLLASYHPSQQNTSTGKLTLTMLEDVFARARSILDGL